VFGQNGAGMPRRTSILLVERSGKLQSAVDVIIGFGRDAPLVNTLSIDAATVPADRGDVWWPFSSPTHDFSL